MAEAAGSVESASARMAASLAAAGLSAEDIASGLKSVGLSTATIAPATEAASAGMQRFGGAMGAARVEMGALEGSTGMMASGLARVAAQSQVLGPIIQAAFPVFAAVALIDILATVGEKVYSAAQNFLFLQDQETALVAITDKLRSSEVSLADSISRSYVEVVKLTQGAVAGATAELSALQNRPIKLPIDEKELKKFPEDIQEFAKSFESITGAGIPGALDAIGAKLKEQKAQLDLVNADISETGDAGVVAYGRQAEQLERNIKLLQQLGQAVVDGQSKLRAETAVGAAELGKSQSEALEKAGRDSERIARESAEGARKAQEDIAKVKMPDAGGAPDPATFQAANEKIAAAAQQSGDQLISATRSQYDQLDDIVALSLERRMETIAKAGEKQRAEEEKTAKASEKDWDGLLRPVNSSIERMTQDVLKGTMSVQMAFQKMGAGILLSTVNTLEKAALKYVEHFLLVEVMEKSSVASRLMTLLTGESVKRATLTASNAMEITGDASRGASAAFSSVLEALPFPVNVATAPGVAATQFSAIEAFAAGSAARGAIVPADMAISAHKGEMVLPEHLSRGVQGAIDRGGFGGGETHNHFHFNGGIHTANPADFAKQLKQMIRRGSLRI
jgi:hypothetical protein